MRGMELILGLNRALSFVGLGSAKLEETRRKLKDLKAQMDQLTTYPDKFNRYFAREGWLAHESLDFEVLKAAVDQYENGGPEAGTKVLMEYFSSETLAGRLFFLNRAEELRTRRRLIELAFEDYQAGRYHAVIPVLLMMIDGAVNDAVGKGFHAGNIELDVWDSLTTADGSIEIIKKIFQRSRQKTRAEAITLPYRNGILHGMDLGYDNEVVAAKCWCFLFVVADWIRGKKSEETRQAKFDEEGRVPALRELAQKVSATDRIKAAIDAWKPRKIEADYLEGLNRGVVPEEGTPEAMAIEFLRLWAQRNFGGMSKLYWANENAGTGAHAGELRSMLGSWEFQDYKIDTISDDAPAISMVEFTLNPGAETSAKGTIRLTYETPEGDVHVRGLPGAAWRLIWVQVSSTASG